MKGTDVDERFSYSEGPTLWVMFARSNLVLRVPMVTKNGVTDTKIYQDNNNTIDIINDWYYDNEYRPVTIELYVSTRCFRDVLVHVTMIRIRWGLLRVPRPCVRKKGKRGAGHWRDGSWSMG